MVKAGCPKRVDTIIFLVDDLARSIRFYRDILRLSLSLKSPTWAEFIIGNTHLALHQKLAGQMVMSPESGGEADISIQLEVSDLNDHIEYFMLHGVEIIGGIKEYKHSRFIFFTDPDGHILSLREYRQLPGTDY